MSHLSAGPQLTSTLRRDNAIAAVLHLVQATAVVTLATGFTLPVTAAYLAGPPGTPASDPVVLFDLPTGAAVAAFLALSALAHLVVCTTWWRLYIADLNRNRNRARWVEYARG
jgi:Heliorhodopsin